MARRFVFIISVARSGVTIAVFAPHAAHQRLTGLGTVRTNVTLCVSTLVIILRLNAIGFCQSEDPKSTWANDPVAAAPGSDPC